MTMSDADLKDAIRRVTGFLDEAERRRGPRPPLSSYDQIMSLNGDHQTLYMSDLRSLLDALARDEIANRAALGAN
jgi:hypothetical protein